MFKKAKQKIVILILSVLCAVLVGTLALVYISSYLSTQAENYQVLEHKTEEIVSKLDSEDNSRKTSIKSDSEKNGERSSEDKYKRSMEVGTFYAVIFYQDGTNAVIENGADEMYSDEELISLAEKVHSGSKGSVDGMIYLVRSNGDETVVSFMDSTVFADSFTTVFFFTVVFGVAALCIIFLISLKLADRIVAPMEQNYQKEKQFTADAGHELKTPIAAISANAELLRRQIGSNKWLENIEFENNRMKSLVTELLELARTENRVPDKRPTDLSHLINGLLLPLEAAAYEKNILIRSDIPDGIVANIDENDIRKLISILLDNAIAHSTIFDNEFAEVNAVLTAENREIVLRISNWGEEISKENLERIFERFYRSDDSHEYTGHYGLGLAIAKAVADKNNCRLSVSCQNGYVIFQVVFQSK